MAIHVKDSSGTTTEQTNKPKVVVRERRWSHIPPEAVDPTELTKIVYHDINGTNCSVLNEQAYWASSPTEDLYFKCLDIDNTYTLDTVKVKDASGTYTVYPHQVLVKLNSVGHSYTTSLTGGVGDTMSIPTAFTTAPSGYRIVSYHKTGGSIPSPQNKIEALPTTFPSQDETYLRYIKGQTVSAEPYCVRVGITPEGYREIDIYNNDNASGTIYYRIYGSASSYTSTIVNPGSKTTVYTYEQSIQTYFVRFGTGFTSSATIIY